MLHVQLTVAETEVLPEPEMIIYINRYSTLTKLLYVTACILRFVGYVKSHISKPAGPITVNKLSKAQTLWI